MNIFLKYIIYFLLGIMIQFLLNDDLLEGYGENAFVLLSRIIGKDTNNEYKNQYIGCQNYECDNEPEYIYEELNSKNLEELKTILLSKINETRFSQDEINAMGDANIPNIIKNILKIDKANKYVDKVDGHNSIFITSGGSFQGYNFPAAQAPATRHSENLILSVDGDIYSIPLGSYPAGSSGETLWQASDGVDCSNGVQECANVLNETYANRLPESGTAVNLVPINNLMTFSVRDGNLVITPSQSVRRVEIISDGSGRLNAYSINAWTSSVDILTEEGSNQNALALFGNTSETSATSDTSLDYLSCNNTMDFSPASSLGETDKRCNHKKCCFNTKCSSEDVRALRKSCIGETTLKIDANCYDKQECINNYQLHCCSDTFDPNSEFRSIAILNDPNLLSYTELVHEYIHSEEDTDKLNKILSGSQDITLDQYDYDDLNS